MLNTFQGTVESDPMRIPAPSRAPRRDEGAFASELDRVSTPEPEPDRPTEARADVDDELAAATGEQPVETDDRPAAPAAETDVAADRVHGEELHPAAQSATADVNEVHRSGEPDRRQTAGKGVDAPHPSPSRPTSDAALGSELAELSARTVHQRAVVPAAPAASAAAPTGQSAGDALLRGIDASGQRADGAAARAVTAGYRTSAKATAQMVEQASDSVFKQLMLKITGGGGEMRLRLQPPNLGELDLRMTVEGGNRVSLVIATEHGELADMIQRHVAELAEQMANAGLELTRADVHARDAGTGGRGSEDHARADGDDESAHHDIQRSQRGGYIRADGLDFWV